MLHGERGESFEVKGHKASVSNKNLSNKSQTIFVLPPIKSKNGFHIITLSLDMPMQWTLLLYFTIYKA